jgi:hypothetical protein
MIVVILIVLLGVILVHRINAPKESNEEPAQCKPHQWYTVIDEEGKEHGLICINCTMVPGIED